MAIRRLVIGTFLAVGLSAGCWAGSGPDQLAKLIVSATQSTDNASFISENFSKDVASKLSGSGGSEAPDAVDFDIFTYSQDPDYEQIGKTIKSEVKQADDANAVIHVTFTQYGDEGVIDYHVKKSGERWLIDDVVYPNDSLSLRSALGLK